MQNIITEQDLINVLTKTLGLSKPVSARRFTATCGTSAAVLAGLMQRNVIKLNATDTLIGFSFLKTAQLQTIANLFGIGMPRVARTWKHVVCTISGRSTEVRR